MSLKIQRIIEDLSDTDAEIQTLALTTITRITFDESVTTEQMASLRRRLSEMCSSHNGDIAFLAKKAANYVDSGGRQTQQLARDAVLAAAAATASPAPPNAQQLLGQLAAESDPNRLATLLATLRKCGTTAALERIAVFLSHADDRVRANAVEVFEDVGDKQHIPLLVPLLNDSNNRVKSNVVKTLGKFGDPHVRDYLSTMLDSDKVAMRESAVYAIAQLLKPDMEPLLIRASSDAYEGVRLRAVKCLSACSSKQAVDALTRRIDDNDPAVRDNAIKVLAEKGVNVNDLLEQRRELGLADAAMPYISTPPARPSADDEQFQARVREKVEKSFKLEILNIAQELREQELKATLSRLLFKIGVDAFEMCRHGEIKDKALMVHYYEITRYQDYLRSVSRKAAVGGEPELQTQILSSSLEQYRSKMRASFVRMGKSYAQAFRNKEISAEATPELRTFFKMVQ